MVNNLIVFCDGFVAMALWGYLLGYVLLSLWAYPSEV